MEGMPVTLIVKAPNQQIEDQTIKCELSWTIRRLKGYLSEVYPSKPHTDEQKLIYSGQLLPDTVVLKDVLRRYEGQETHTVHLVCAPSREMYTQKSPVKQKTEVSSPSTNIPQENPVNTNENQSEINTPLPSTSTATVQQPDNSNANEFRHRFTSSSSGTEIPLSPGANSRTWAESLTQPYIHTFEGDPNAFALQMAWMQQAYVNYMAQYMQLYTPNSHVNSVSLPATENNQENINVQPAAENAQVNNVPAPVIDALANDPEDGGHDRDWLDWIYMLSRLAIFFSIVYFYSSPLRFIVVVLLGITIYLYGFFRNQPLENNVNNNINEPGENNNIVDGQNAANRENASNNGAGNAAPILEDRPSLPAVMWTFFTTFFASLIPEVPNAV